MDCEGFQDLRLWCDQSTMGSHDISSTEEKSLEFGMTNTNTTLHNNMLFQRSQEEPAGIWSMISLGDEFSVGNLLLSESHLDDNLEDDVMNMHDYLDVKSLDIHNMPIIFKDFSKNEDSVNILSNGEVFMGAAGLRDEALNPEEHIIIKDEYWDMPVEREVSVEDTPVDDRQVSVEPTYTPFQDLTQLQYMPTTEVKGMTDSTVNHYRNLNTPIASAIVCQDDQLEDEKQTANEQHLKQPKRKSNVRNLNLNLGSCVRYNLSEFRNLVPVVTTPDVLMTVEQLEEDKGFNLFSDVKQPQLPSPAMVGTFLDSGYCEDQVDDSIVDVTPPETPKLFEPEVRAFKKRRNSNDSDVSYVPPTERKLHKTQRSKRAKVVSIPALKSILELDIPRKKGRPPKRRESLASTCTYTTDDNASTLSVEELRYRELRDKNNEASRRSRKSRKLKELENEKLADELEERNRMLTHKAERLEAMAKLLKDALMAAMLKR